MMSKDIPSKINIEDDYSKSKVKQEIIIIEKTNNDEYYIKDIKPHEKSFIKSLYFYMPLAIIIGGLTIYFFFK